ncbi:MAG: hypothetical protein R3B82_22705 [Sandaracinaceae bacterium]
MTRAFRVSLLLLLVACESPPPANDAGTLDAGATDAGMLDAGATDAGGPTCEGLTVAPPATACAPLASDYAPAVDDEWPACVSDDGEYHRILPDISSVARVMAYEEIAALLFDPTRDPSSMDFLDARLIYQRDEGLDSRVVRRYDPHVEVPDGTDCTLDGVPASFPDYCVGPAVLGPLLLDALAAGIAGDGGEPARVHAARIEAALLWFLAVSTYKESLTCTTTAKDCDSAYAYYTGGEPARGGLGLAREVAAVAPSIHDRAWDGLLAVRCWRDLDPGEPATDPAMRDRAREQLDREVTRGVAAILRDRLVRACATDGAELAYQWAFARVLGGFLDRAMRAADPAAADALADALAPTAPGDPTAAVAAIDAAFDCR